MMTDQQLDALDRWLTEKVMGWDPNFLRDADANIVCWEKEYPPDRVELWSPTRDWRSAGILLEVITDAISVVKSVDQAFCYQWSCHFGILPAVQAATAPLAISLAVAKAYGWKDD